MDNMKCEHTNLFYTCRLSSWLTGISFSASFAGSPSPWVLEDLRSQSLIYFLFCGHSLGDLLPSHGFSYFQFCSGCSHSFVQPWWLLSPTPCLRVQLPSCASISVSDSPLKLDMTKATCGFSPSLILSRFPCLHRWNTQKLYSHFTLLPLTLHLPVC